jgi:hypothetical protein
VNQIHKRSSFLWFLTEQLVAQKLPVITGCLSPGSFFNIVSARLSFYKLAAATIFLKIYDHIVITENQCIEIENNRILSILNGEMFQLLLNGTEQERAAVKVWNKV